MCDEGKNWRCDCSSAVSKIVPIYRRAGMMDKTCTDNCGVRLVAGASAKDLELVICGVSLGPKTQTSA